MKTRSLIFAASLLAICIAAGIWGQALPGTAGLALSNAAMTVGGTSCALGSSCSPSVTVGGTTCTLGSSCSPATGTTVTQAPPYLTVGGTVVGPIFALTAPSASGWSWANQGGSTVSTSNTSLLLSFVANLGNDHIRCYMRSLPASTGYTADIAMLTVSHAVGMAISDGTKYVFIWQNGAGNFSAFDFNTTTSVGSPYFTPVTNTGTTAPMLWMRFKDVGGARQFFICSDTDTCSEINTQTTATFLTETTYGVCYETNQTYPGAVKLTHVSATTP